MSRGTTPCEQNGKDSKTKKQVSSERKGLRRSKAGQRKKSKLNPSNWANLQELTPKKLWGLGAKERKADKNGNTFSSSTQKAKIRRGGHVEEAVNSMKVIRGGRTASEIGWSKPANFRRETHFKIPDANINHGEDSGEKRGRRNRKTGLWNNILSKTRKREKCSFIKQKVIKEKQKTGDSEHVEETTKPGKARRNPKTR